MLFLTALYVLANSVSKTTGGPLDLSTTAPTACHCNANLNAREVVFEKNYRSIWDIIWTCLATIFACTWVAIHPNLRGYKATYWERFLQRIELMLWAIIIPEAITVWAFRQWIGARKILADVRELKKKESLEEEDPGFGDGERAPPAEWTMVHAQFFQMGGYIFKDETGFRYIDWADLTREDDTEFVRHRTALLLRPDTKDEIADKSKSDGFAKVFVIIQTVWFLAQCVARAIQGLFVTELEVTTTAYIAVSLVFHFFWWHKPLDAECPIIVHVRLPQQDESSKDAASRTIGLGDEEEAGTVEDGRHDRAAPGGRFGTVMERCLGKQCRRIFRWTTNWSAPLRIVAFVVLLLPCIIEHFLYRLAKPCGLQTSLTGQRAPTFYAFYPGNTRHDYIGLWGVIIISTIFGGIHCIAWGFTFSSILE
ncbi:hypothetical protein CC1G_08495 [Coprinopsis cinerea okayama7|uniref:Uncharacterized protein n=1 Tax=Coprinopsis cinerea (strain Okayama-7 / 130 / ATCC MYA-4618 / FGSC 9003) TaxID=240176 RepID=A8NM57_COPC7|nr:hypothetical protein CC1G_08495 [Coprinopsis cinerea okayama7\|eukprot:XP_001834850.2 hypothetical protein CC1G_08495 [Coprinopsis cinerea okayama7\